MIVRHAAAVERGSGGFEDDDRPLTPEGERKFKESAKGAARLFDPPAAILTSPLPRALRTAEILRDAFGPDVPLKPTTALSYGTLQELEALLSPFPDGALVAIVGHEPTLSERLARLVGAKDAGPFAFKKGGMALVELGKGLQPGAMLEQLLPPKALREIG